MSAPGTVSTIENYAASGGPAAVGFGVGVAVRDTFASPFERTGWVCSTYSNFRESSVSVTGP